MGPADPRGAEPRPARDVLSTPATFNVIWFPDANLRALSGRTCPRPDQAFMQRLIDYGIATGAAAIGASVVEGIGHGLAWILPLTGSFA
jgi:hypothetical protein